MRRIGLISPQEISPFANVGAEFITRGIRNLVSQALPDATFFPLDMMNEKPEQWAIASMCDTLILCGNPRFNLSETGQWWDTGIWDRLIACQQAGIKVIDGWAGACYPHGTNHAPMEQMVAEISAIPRNRRLLDLAPLLHARIARDDLMQAIYTANGVQSVQMPCSSAYAFEPRTSRALSDLIVIIAMPHHDHWLPRTLRNMLDQQPSLRFIATRWDDYLWGQKHFLSPRLIYDPDGLVALYQRARNVLSFRVHQAIPAAMAGASVTCIEIDTRAMTCHPFGLATLPLDRIEEWNPTGHLPGFLRPDPSRVVARLKEILC